MALAMELQPGALDAAAAEAATESPGSRGGYPESARAGWT